MRKTKLAFGWIFEILNKNKIKFQISGGFTARVYGSKRKLADIDIVIQNRDFERIYDEVKDHIKFGPNRYLDGN